MEHLLLATLGEAPGALLSLFDWLNCRPDWPEEQHLRVPTVPLTDVWVLTTASKLIDPRADLIGPLESAFPALRRRVLRVPVEDILTEADHRLMAEVLFRLVLQAETWRRGRAGRVFSVSLAGGRKSMSALLQQAVTFFEADNVFHVSLVQKARGEPPPRTLEQVRARRDWHYVVRLADEPTPWRPLLAEPWRRTFAGTELGPELFPLAEDGEEPRLVRAIADPHCPSLVDGLRQVADLTHVFAGQALACGVGAQFLRHDLRRVVRSLGDGAEAAALRDYLDGLEHFLDDRLALHGASWPLARLGELCDRALLLAVGRAVPRHGADAWHGPREIRLTLSEWHGGDERRAVRGVDGPLLLLVLRNLLANVHRHGHSAAWDEPHAVLCLDAAPAGLTLTLRNRVPRENLSTLLALARPDGALPDLTRPLFRVGNHDGQGLGLFAVQEVARRTDGAVRFDPPRLEPAGPDAWDFVVSLRFTRVATEVS